MLDVSHDLSPELQFAFNIKRPRRDSWSDERTDTLKKLWDEGYSAAQIAKELGETTRNAVLGKVHRLGLSMRRSPALSAPRKPRGPRIRVFTYHVNRRRDEARRQPKERVRELIPPPDFLGISFLDIKPNQCHFPKGEGREILFCGQPVQSGSSYCSHCHRICYPPSHGDVRREEKRRQMIDMAERYRVAIKEAPV